MNEVKNLMRYARRRFSDDWRLWLGYTGRIGGRAVFVVVIRVVVKAIAAVVVIVVEIG